MSWELYRNLAWLPAPPADFSARCKKLPERHTDFGTEIRALATYGLDEHQLARLGRTIDSVRSKGESLSPLTPFRLGVLGNGILDLIVPVLVATAARHGIALECVKGGYDQFLQDSLLPGLTSTKPVRTRFCWPWTTGACRFRPHLVIRPQPNGRSIPPPICSIRFGQPSTKTVGPYVFCKLWRRRRKVCLDLLTGHSQARRAV